MSKYRTTAAEFLGYINSLPKDIYFDDSNEELWDLLWIDEGSGWRVKAGREAHEFDVRKDHGGILRWQGRKGQEPEGFVEGEAVEIAFLRWKSSQTHQTVVLSVPKEQVSAVRELLSKFGIVVP